jgi:hypothetical protein
MDIKLEELSREELETLTRKLFSFVVLLENLQVCSTYLSHNFTLFKSVKNSKFIEKEQRSEQSFVMGRKYHWVIGTRKI